MIGSQVRPLFNTEAAFLGAGPAMADNLSIDRRTSALLVMDFQTLIVDNYAAGAEALLDRTAKLIAVARTAGIRVIYVVVGFRPGYPEVSDRNATFNGLKASGAFAAGAENAKIHPAVAPLAGEIVVTKHRVSAFFATDLDLILREWGVKTVIISGTTTENCCHATARDAMFRNYQVAFLSDATGTFDYPDVGQGALSAADVHLATLTILAFSTADVMTVDEFKARVVGANVAAANKAA